MALTWKAWDELVYGLEGWEFERTHSLVIPVTDQVRAKIDVVVGGGGSVEDAGKE